MSPTDALTAEHAPTPAGGAGAAGRRTGWARIAPGLAGLGYLLPSLVLIGLFTVVPALWTLYLGLTNSSMSGPGAAHPTFQGLSNYTRAFTDPQFRDALLLTLVFTVCSVVGQMVLGFVIAWTGRRVVAPLRRLLQIVTVLSWIVPGAVVAFLWTALLDQNSGTLNAILGTHGTAWLLRYPMASVIVFNIWRGTAFSMLMFDAALAGVPPTRLETARLMGASTTRQIRDVVLPAIRGQVLSTMLLVVLATVNDFSIYLITAGGPDGRTQTLPVYIYNTALSKGDIGFGSALSLLLLVLNVILAVITLRLSRRRR